MKKLTIKEGRIEEKEEEEGEERRRRRRGATDRWRSHATRN